MQRNLRPALLALLCVLAVALGAATLQSTVAPDVGPGGSGPSGIGSSGGDVGVGGQNQTSATGDGAPLELQFDAWCVPFLQTDAFAVLATLLALLAAAVLYHRGGPLYVGAALAATFVPAVVAYFLLTDCGPATPLAFRMQPFAGPGQNGSIFSGAAGSAGGAPTITPAAVVLLGVFVVGVAVALLRATDDDTEETDSPGPDPDPDPAPEESLTAVGAAAGAAAERIDAAADVENEVFRAWREMTTHLDVSNPATSTPAEFATAARAAGMDGADVDALTDLFREVRYGGEQPTPEREGRAVAALRSIEETYAEVSGADTEEPSADAEEPGADTEEPGTGTDDPNVDADRRADR